MPKHAVLRKAVAPQIASGEQSGESSVELSGFLVGILISAPDLTGANYSITITDSDDFQLFTQASLTKNQATQIYKDADNMPLRLPAGGTYTVTVNSGSNEASDRDFAIKLLMENR